FFEGNPEAKGDEIVHHAREQQVLNRYPGVYDAEEIHSLDNLRGIPPEANKDLHLRDIRKDWDDFYDKTPPNSLTREQIRQQIDAKVDDIDVRRGGEFSPPLERKN